MFWIEFADPLQAQQEGKFIDIWLKKFHQLNQIGFCQISANRGPNLRFVLKAIIKALMSKSNSSLVIKLMDQGRILLESSH